MRVFHKSTPVPLPVENSALKRLAVVLAFAVPVFFCFLGANSVWDINEAFYVETPRQMLRSGDYVNPAFNGAPRFNKPVLSYWIVAGLYRALGDSVTVERIGIAIGALGIVLAAFLIGRALRSTLTGVLAALAIATAPRVVWFARKIFIDVYLTTFTSLALAAFVLAQVRPARRRRYLVLMYIALGLGVLTKGPVAVAIPALACILWLAAERRLADVRRLMLLPGAGIVLVIVLPWYLLVYLQHGWPYITSFLFEENLQRFATTAMAPGDRDAAFYLPVLFGELFPWAPLVVAPLISIGVRLRSKPPNTGASIERLLWFWIVAFVVVFSFSRTKEDLYIFPIVPAVAALVAAALCDSFVNVRARLLGGLFVATSGLCVAAAFALGWLFGPSAGYYALAEARPYAFLVGLTGAAACALWLTARRPAAVTALALGLVASNYVLIGSVLPAVERSKPVPPLALVVSRSAAPDAKLGSFKMGLQSFVYYTDHGRVEEIGGPEQAKAFFLDSRESWALMGAAEWEIVRDLVPDVCVAAHHQLSIFDAKLADIISRRPPDDVLLVRNHCGRSSANSRQPRPEREAQRGEPDPDDHGKHREPLVETRDPAGDRWPGVAQRGHSRGADEVTGRERIAFREAARQAQEQHGGGGEGQDEREASHRR